MTDLQVYYAKRRQAGSIRVDATETFLDVKERIINKYSDHSDNEESIFSTCILELPQPFVKQRGRSRVTPGDSAVVEEFLSSLYATNIFGRICLTVIDTRRSAAAAFPQISADEQFHAALLATSDKPESFGEGHSCTNWATTGYNSVGTGSGTQADGDVATPISANSNEGAVTAVPWLFQPVTVLDSLFDELTSSAVIQGRLQKKIYSPRKQELWRYGPLVTVCLCGLLCSVVLVVLRNQVEPLTNDGSLL
jgi:hypothetical protein